LGKIAPIEVIRIDVIRIDVIRIRTRGGDSHATSCYDGAPPGDGDRFDRG